MDENKNINNIITSYEWEERYKEYMLNKFNLKECDWRYFCLIERCMDASTDSEYWEKCYTDLFSIGITYENEQEMLEEYYKYKKEHPYPETQLEESVWFQIPTFPIDMESELPFG